MLMGKLDWLKFLTHHFSVTCNVMTCIISLHFELTHASLVSVGNEKIASIFEEMSMVQKLKRDRFRSQAPA